MKVKIYAGRFTVGSWTTIPEFMEWMRAKNRERVDWGENRQIHVANLPHCTAGFNFVVRNQRSFLEMTESDAGIVLNLREATNPTEFNFFAMRHDTGGLVFSHYRGCQTSIGEFGRILKKRYRQFAEHSNRSKRSTFDRIMSRKTWDEEIARFSRIKQFSSTVEVYEEDGGPFAARDVKSVRRVVTFAGASRTARIVDGIHATIERIAPKRASCRGERPDGSETTVQMDHNAEVLAELEYDDLAEPIVLVGDQFLKGTWAEAMMPLLERAAIKRKAP